MAEIAPEEIKVEVDWDFDNLPLKTEQDSLEVADSTETETSDVEDKCEIESYPKYDEGLKKIYVERKRKLNAEPAGGVREGGPCAVTMDVTNESKSAKKRARTENWLDEDRRLLKGLVRQRVQAIENKNTDTNTNKRKKDAWTDLQAIFNSLSRTRRNIAQLKNQWAGMKIAAKKEKGRDVFRTGPEPNDRQEEDITAWLPCECTAESAEYHSDFVATAVNERQRHEDPVAPAPAPHAVYIEMSVENKPTVETLRPPEMDPPRDECVNDTPTSSSSCKSIDKRIKASKTKILKKKIKKVENSTASAAAVSIAENENNYRMELHRLQMENERKRGRNLDVEYQILRARLHHLTQNNSSD